jgi:hypothetical protein
MATTTKRVLENKQGLLEKSLNDLRVTKAGLQAMVNDPKVDETTRKDLVINLNATMSQIEKEQHDLEKVTNEIEEKFLKKQLSNEKNVVKALNELNSYYISSEQNWYCIYAEPNRRHQPKVNIVSTSTMRDMVFGDTGWQTERDWDLKEIARANNRYYRDVERSFLPESQNTLNQMNELREFWLKPIYDEQPHEAFDVLMLNLVGGDVAYKEQIEKYIAYSYEKPEDIFAPNIDSSAKGGVGRDTLFRILEIIFTEECCGEAKKETVQGTHNGELWGKVWVKISESNNRAMDINELKNLTGGHNFRLRRMKENAIQAPRTFRFFMMSNNYEGTARLTGGGSTAEDRRWEPIFGNTSLIDRIVMLKGISVKEASEMLQEWQQNVYQDERHIAIWLGYLLTKYQPKTITKLRPLHGAYYNEMVERQKNSFSIFMEKIINLSVVSNCYDVDKMHKIFKIISNTQLNKENFGKKMCEWLMTQTNSEWTMKVRNIYRSPNDDTAFRVKRQTIALKEQIKIGRPTEDENDKLVFDIFEFIDEEDEKGFTICDEKSKELGDKPHPNNIKQELF